MPDQIKKFKRDLNSLRASRPKLLGMHKQALLSLNKSDYSTFINDLANIGELIQKELVVDNYRVSHEVFKQALAKLNLPDSNTITNTQKLNFYVFEHAWRDESLARLRKIKFTRNKDEAVEPDSCLLVWEEGGYKEIIPVNSLGQKLSAIKISTMDEVAAMASKLTEKLADKTSENYSSEENQLVDVLKRVLKRENKQDLDLTSLTAKSALSKETRHRVKLGLEYFKFIHQHNTGESIASLSQNLPLTVLQRSDQPSFIERMSFAPMTYVIVGANGPQPQVWLYKNKFSFSLNLTKQLGKSVLNEPTKLRNKLLTVHCHYLDKQACAAIRSYKTKSEKITHAFGTTLAALTAFTYGTLEFGMAMMGFYVALGVVWSNLWLAIAGSLLIGLGLLLPIPSTWTNWKVFSTYLPEFFNKIRGEYNEINTKAKKALFWGLSLFAFATGLAAGGLAYTSTIALPGLMGLGAISAIFPPIGIFLGAAVVICQTCMLLRNFCNILRKQDSWKAFVKPFHKVDKVLKENKAGTGRKIVTWAIVGGLILFSVLGLAMSCFTSTRSVGKFFIDQLNATPERALVWGVAISGIGSFLSRIYFTLDAAISSGVIIFKRLASEYFTNLPSLPFKKKAAIITDTLQAGGFYAQSVLAQSQQTAQELSRDINLYPSGMSATTTGLLATGAFLITSTRYFAINTNHTDEPEDPHEKVRKQATNSRIKNTKDNFLKDNPNLLFSIACSKDVTSSTVSAVLSPVPVIA